MCEYNRPYPVPFGQHPDDRYRSGIVVLPKSAWQEHRAQLPQAEIETIDQAGQDAATIACDVHIYRRLGSPFVGIALEPGTGPTVKIWEH